MSSRRRTPPLFARRFFRWYCNPRLADHIEGDLIEVYQEEIMKSGKLKADIRYFIDVLTLCRPGIIRPYHQHHSTLYAMYKSYFKIGWRNIVKDKGYSFINIGGLALGIAVAMMIGLWVQNELSHNKYHDNYNSIALVMQHNTYDGTIDTYANQSYQLGDELRNNYGNYFKHVVMSYQQSAVLSQEETAFTIQGAFMEEDGPELLSLRMIHGSNQGLDDISSIMISSSTAKKYFKDQNVIGKLLKLDNSLELKVIGVYEDLPVTSDFHKVDFIAPLQIEINRGNRALGWVNNWLLTIVELEENINVEQASLAIKDVKIRNVAEYDRRFKPELFLHPMSKWHLYSDFKNGVNTGGDIETVWMFGSIGAFVLLLACINFINLTTARSQKRAKEVGVRKVIGSARGQLIRQFFIESLLIVTFAFIVALLLVQLTLPFFNEVSEKALVIEWSSATLWIYAAGFIFITAFLAGSYPAVYLSSFNPIKVIKGTFKFGRFSSTPRKALVIIQFSISIILAIGTIVVYQQIEYARNRPVGYDMKGLVTIPIKTQEVKNTFEAFKTEALASRVAAAVSTSETTVANMWWSDWGFQWQGKDPAMQDNIYRGAIDYDFGKTVGWRIKLGRDFSKDFPSDSSAMILNEAAVRYMGFDDPVGQTITSYGRTYTVIGVVEDMVTQSLYHPTGQTIFLLDRFKRENYINIRMNPDISAQEALTKLENIFKKYNPSTPFDYNFIDDEYSDKFKFEARVGKLVGIFSVLAIFISCLGLFGLASFMSEKRVKEIGIRKVMGASVAGLWRMLTKDFVTLVIVASLIAAPLGYYLMNSWLSGYNYRTEVSVWVLVSACVGALLIALLTVSFQALKAAFMNPVRSLRVE